MGAHEEVRPVLPMPIKATPYRHQIEAFNFACGLFGLRPEAEQKSMLPEGMQSCEGGGALCQKQ